MKWWMPTLGEDLKGELKVCGHLVFHHQVHGCLTEDLKGELKAMYSSASGSIITLTCEDLKRELKDLNHPITPPHG